VLTIVHNEQRLSGLEASYSVAVTACRGRSSIPNASATACGTCAASTSGASHEQDSIRILIMDVLDQLQTQPRLANSARADKSDMAVPREHLSNGDEFLLAPHKAGHLRGWATL
jgi:hypothetical protein